MPSPYHRAKSPVSFEIPELRDELLFTQRALYQLCQLENERDQRGAYRAHAHLMKLIGSAFPENLHDLAEDFHSASDWALRQKQPPARILRASILFAGSLLQRQEVAAALPLLKKIGEHVTGDRELKSIWAINYAIGLERLLGTPQEELWETAINEMPLSRWMHYPGLSHGARSHIRRLRMNHEERGDLQSLLAAAPLAERVYAAITQPCVKGSAFEASGPAVRLLIEVARIQHSMSQDAFGPLALPPSVRLFERAALNAALNRSEEDLFVRALTTLANHHSLCGEREKAREIALRALVELGSLRKQHPKLIETIRAIFEANK